jgi:hypothetical protein
MLFEVGLEPKGSQVVVNSQPADSPQFQFTINRKQFLFLIRNRPEAAAHKDIRGESRGIACKSLKLQQLDELLKHVGADFDPAKMGAFYNGPEHASSKTQQCDLLRGRVFAIAVYQRLLRTKINQYFFSV